MASVSLIATLTTPPSSSGAELTALPSSVDWLEVRADLLGDINPELLRRHFQGRLLYSLRSRTEDNHSPDSRRERKRRLQTAARHYDRVELEASGDLSPDLMATIPADKRLLSWYGLASDVVDLQAAFAQMSSVPAAAYKLITSAARMADEFVPLFFLKTLGRTDTVAYCEGPLGFWSRLAALQLGAPAIFGLVTNDPDNPAQPAIEKLIANYGLPEVQPVTEIFAIIGNPIFHSLSPRLHNASYRATNHPALFVPLQVESFEEFWREVVCSKVLDSLGMPIKGLTVASPHKEAALLSVNEASPMSRRIESANILVRSNGSWAADTTDPDIVYVAGQQPRIRLSRRQAAVIGCGGAGRAIAAALVQSGTEVTLINRGAARGHYASKLLGLPFRALSDFDAEGYDIIVNATPIGREAAEVPFNLDSLDKKAIVIDLVYGARPTPLIGSARSHQQVAIDGHDVLMTQVLKQFRMMTGKEMSSALALETLRPASGFKTPEAKSVR
jgi:3-dehydroquinate dehydratase/shikimate dehydrogenase